MRHLLIEKLIGRLSEERQAGRSHDNGKEFDFGLLDRKSVV